MADEKVPFFAAGESKSEEAPNDVEEMTDTEVKKMKIASNLRNANGVEYAPWMNISKEDEQKIKQVMAEKAEARRKRQLQERQVSGALLMDSQAQELSGAGLKAKCFDEQVEFELEGG